MASRFTILGLGVAGSTAAILLARLGARVRGYDVMRRYWKPCGEVVPVGLLGLLRSKELPMPAVVDEITVYKFYSVSEGLLRVYEAPRPLWASIEKGVWVERLRGEAAARGAQLVYSRPPLAGRGVVVDARGPFASRGSRVVVWRAYAENTLGSGYALMMITQRPFGLAWAFSHGDKLNIGGGFIGVGQPRGLVVKLLERMGNVEGVELTRGLSGGAYSLVTLFPRVEPVAGDVLRIGEAAGLIQSLGGEGIRPAVASAIALAEAAEEEDIATAYLRRIEPLVLEARFSSLLLAAASLLGPHALKRLSDDFMEAWLAGRLGDVRSAARRLLAGR